jgi:Protein of unknown function (DUF433)
VYDVLEWLASGMSTAEIIEDFPELTPEDIQAACAYAAPCATQQVLPSSVCSIFSRTCASNSDAFSRRADRKRRWAS